MFSGIVVGTGKVNKVIKFEDYNELRLLQHCMFLL